MDIYLIKDNNEMKVISLGVGVQSTVLYYMSSIGELPRADVAIFADTGAEKTATSEYYDYLLNWQKENNGIPIYKATYKDLMKDLKKQTNSSGNRFASIPAYSANGGMLRRQCTSEYKIQQVDKKIKEILGLDKHARFPKCEIWYGITLDEIRRVAVPVQKWKTNIYPLIGYGTTHDGKSYKVSDIVMRRGDLNKWYEDHNLPIPARSSCVFCPFQSDKNWLHLKRNYPNDFQDAIDVDRLIRDSSKRGIKEKIFVHKSMKPLSEVKFDENQLEFDECSGECML